MTDGCGPRWSEPFAWFDPDTSSWRTCHPSLLTTLGESSSVTWPRSGTWGAGFAYEHPTSALAIDESASSSLLPTPNTLDGMAARSDEALARAKTKGGCSNLKDVLPQLLPTPMARDGNPRGTQDPAIRLAAGHAPNLNDVIEKGLPNLLPTPRATRGGSATETVYALNGATMPPPSPDTPPSSDDLRLSLWTSEDD